MNKKQRNEIDTFLDENESRAKSTIVICLSYEGQTAVALQGQTWDFAFMRLCLENYLHKVLEGEFQGKHLAVVPKGNPHA